jgi:iron complex outermembrane receptor protein
VREGPDRKRSSLTSVAAGNLSLMDGRLIISGQYRNLWSENEFYEPAPLPYLPPTPAGKVTRSTESPQGGIRVRVNGNLTLKGNIGEYTRMPTFFELFGNIGTVSGNPALEPEKGINRDIGAVFTSGKFGPVSSLFAEGSYFDREVTNLILFFPNSQRTVKPKNIGAAVIRGLELTLSARVLSSLRVSGNYTWIDSSDDGEIPYYRGNQLASTPAHEGSLKLSLERRRWSAGYGLHYIGANYLDKANMQEVPARQLHSLSFSVKEVMDHFRFTLEGRNLTDNQIRDVIGYPLPGRSFYFTVEYILKG